MITNTTIEGEEELCNFPFLLDCQCGACIQRMSAGTDVEYDDNDVSLQRLQTETTENIPALANTRTYSNRRDAQNLINFYHKKISHQILWLRRNVFTYCNNVNRVHIQPCISLLSMHFLSWINNFKYNFNFRYKSLFFSLSSTENIFISKLQRTMTFSSRQYNEISTRGRALVSYSINYIRRIFHPTKIESMKRHLSIIRNNIQTRLNPVFHLTKEVVVQIFTNIHTWSSPIISICKKLAANCLEALPKICERISFYRRLICDVGVPIDLVVAMAVYDSIIAILGKRLLDKIWHYSLTISSRGLFMASRGSETLAIILNRCAAYCTDMAVEFRRSNFNDNDNEGIGDGNHLDHSLNSEEPLNDVVSPSLSSVSGNAGGNLCIICMDSPVDCVLVHTCRTTGLGGANSNRDSNHSGHSCTCYSCGLGLFRNRNLCPICRQTLQIVVKTFF